MDLARRVAEQATEIEKLRGYADYLERRLDESRQKLHAFEEIETVSDEQAARLRELERLVTRVRERNGRLKKRAKFWRRVASFRHRPARRRGHG